MKKKNVLMMALSLCLVAVVAIGGTLAYLTATPDEVTNTFTFVEGDGDGNVITVAVTEEEPVVTGGVSVDGDSANGWDYTNVVPGQELNKKPVISATAYVPSYVFVRVTAGEWVSVVETSKNPDWQLVPGKSNVYYKEITETMIADAGAGNTINLEELFTQVKVKDSDTIMNGEDVQELNDVKIEVSAVAKGSFADAKTAYEEVGEDMFQPAVGG